MSDPPTVGHSAGEQAWAAWAREHLPGKTVESTEYRRRRRMFLAGWAAREVEVQEAQGGGSPVSEVVYCGTR